MPDETKEGKSGFLVSSRAGNVLVSEETALSIVARYMQGFELIEYSGLDGGTNWVTRRALDEITETSPELREWNRIHNAGCNAEKKAGGHFDDAD